MQNPTTPTVWPTTSFREEQIIDRAQKVTGRPVGGQHLSVWAATGRRLARVRAASEPPGLDQHAPHATVIRLGRLRNWFSGIFALWVWFCHSRGERHKWLR